MAREKGMGSLQREKSGRWTMRVGIGGKRFCRSTRTTDRNQAERVLQRFLAPFGLGESRLPLAEVWNAYVMSPDRNELAQSTLNAKRIVWMHFARWMERYYLPVKGLADISHEMISEYLSLLRVDLCGSTYNGRVCVLREIFRTLAARAGIRDDPWSGVRLRPNDCRSRRELTTDELRRLLVAAKNYGDEWYKLFLTGIYTGLRLGDCCKLDWSSINPAQKVIQLIPSKTRRYAHGRPVTIPIHPVLGVALLSESASDKVQLSGPVLPMVSELYRADRYRMSNRLSAIFRAAGITTSVKLEGRKGRTPVATFHSLRHTFVSLAANAGVPLHVVQSIVGHASTAMTRHYYHENMVALRSAVDAIPAIVLSGPVPSIPPQNSAAPMVSPNSNMV